MAGALAVASSILVPLGLFAMIVLLVWVAHRSREAEGKHRAETQKHFLDKFGSGQELADFLATETGHDFLDQFAAKKRDSFLEKFFDPRSRALRMIVPGIILTLLGLGMLALTVAGEDLLVAGVVLLSIGLGFLISIAVMGRVSKKWEPTKDEGPKEAEQVP